MLNFQGNTWDLVLLAIAAYVAVLTLVRLMLTERERLGKELDQQIAAEQAKLAVEKRKADKERRQKDAQDEYDRKRKAA
jgi:Tfp pilus assembly protein PilN